MADALTTERLERIITHLRDPWQEISPQHLNDLEKLVKMHRPRTERKNSGCIACGTIWPCATISEVVVQRLGEWMEGELRIEKFWSGG